jgi:predicted nucleotidyltransferase
MTDCLPRPADEPPAIGAQLEALRQSLAGADSGLVCAYLFGSTARGVARPGSDLDVAVLFASDPPHTLAGLHLDLADDLSAATGRPVDLVVLNRAPVDLVHRVLRDGILLLERDRSARISFEVHARAEYFDLLPYLQRYRRTAPEARP